jgi:hypothetical protein
MTTMEDAERRLRRVCENRQFGYSLVYSEVEGNYHGEIWSAAPSEYAEVKRCATLQEAMERLAERAEEKFPLEPGS